MMIALSDAQSQTLLAFLKQSEDVEQLTDAEYAVDIYTLEPPLSLQLELQQGGIDVLAAAELAYDKALDGWYLKERIEDGELVKERLLQWLMNESCPG